MSLENQSQSLSNKINENPQKNPRKAATKLKEMQINLQIMKNRFKVLEGQNDYNRYRTLDHTKRIERHISIHQKISKQKQQTRKSLESMSVTGQLKQKNQIIRKQIKETIQEARKSVLDDRLNRSQIVNTQFIQNQMKIKNYWQNEFEMNKLKRNAIIQDRQQKRDSLKKHFQNKIEITNMDKSRASQTMNNQAKTLHEQLQRMMEFQKKLLQQNSQSLQASQLMKNKYNKVISLSQRSQSYKLPEIRTASKQTNHSAI